MSPLNTDTGCMYSFPSMGGGWPWTESFRNLFPHRIITSNSPFGWGLATSGSPGWCGRVVWGGADPAWSTRTECDLWPRTKRADSLPRALSLNWCFYFRELIRFPLCSKEKPKETLTSKEEFRMGVFLALQFSFCSKIRATFAVLAALPTICATVWPCLNFFFFF